MSPLCVCGCRVMPGWGGAGSRGGSEGAHPGGGPTEAADSALGARALAGERHTQSWAPKPWAPSVVSGRTLPHQPRAARSPLLPQWAPAGSPRLAPLAGRPQADGAWTRVCTGGDTMQG